MRYRAIKDLIWRHWDDEFVVYNPQSGDSHLLDYLSAQGLIQMEKHAMSAQELTAAVSAALGTPDDKNLSEFMDRTVSELFELGLTEGVSP